MLMIKFVVSAIAVASCSLTAVAQKYHVTSVSRERIMIDKRYAADKDAEALLAPYKHKVDSVMSPLVGRSAKYMRSHGPESELSNLRLTSWCGLARSMVRCLMSASTTWVAYVLHCPRVTSTSAM